MSEENLADTTTSCCCASCGVAGVDDIKLKECTDCDLVRYCSDECQKDHRPQHEPACKKRVAELRDEILFRQPESTHLGDCPICLIPMPLEVEKSFIHRCCSKVICIGCAYANALKAKEGTLACTCPFCRQPFSKNDEEMHKNNMKRVEMNDPFAICHQGLDEFNRENYQSAFEHFMKAAKLGDVEACYRVGFMHLCGDHVEKDQGKAMQHLEEAAIRGHPCARHKLGCEERMNGHIERSVKHWITAAAQGHVISTKHLMHEFRCGMVRKDDLATALRAHQAALDATKSPQREAVEEARRKNGQANVYSF